MTNEDDIKEAISFLYDSLLLSMDVIRQHAAERPEDFPGAEDDLTAISQAAEAHRATLIAAGLLPGDEPATEVAPDVHDAITKLSSTSSGDTL